MARNNWGNFLLLEDMQPFSGIVVLHSSNQYPFKYDIILNKVYWNLTFYLIKKNAILRLCPKETSFLSAPKKGLNVEC
jgi:hypothetical protein